MTVLQIIVEALAAPGTPADLELEPLPYSRERVEKYAKEHGYRISFSTSEVELD
jgi:hypothetical protein